MRPKFSSRGTDHYLDMDAYRLQKRRTKRKKRVRHHTEDEDCSFLGCVAVCFLIFFGISIVLIPVYLLKSSGHGNSHSSSYSLGASSNYRMPKGSIPGRHVDLPPAPDVYCAFWAERDAVLNKTTSNAEAARQGAVKEAMLHAWTAYEGKCWGVDELNPISGSCYDWLHQGLTIVDSIDTLLIMGLKDQYNQARKYVAEELSFDHSAYISFFETIIRVVASLVTSYEMTDDSIYLDKAEELATKLLAAFDTPTGFPKSRINLATGQTITPKWQRGYVVLAELGTIQLEFHTLSKHLSKPWFGDKVEAVTQKLNSMDKPFGALYPLYVDPNTARWKKPHQISLGAMGDSFYEYLLKMYLLTDRTMEHYGTMYRQSIAAVLENLLQHDGEYTYLAEWKDQHIHKQDHLACFFPGLLALGVAEGVDVTGSDLRIAKDLVKTCVRTYTDESCGIAAEHVKFHPYREGDKSYHLRPETVESLFILWRVTGDQQYRDWAWTIFQAINKHARWQAGGFVGIQDVTQPQGQKIDRQESFFLAETLKYLYLIFSDDDLIPITGEDAYVLNTEAHPIRKWGWTDRRKAAAAARR